MTDTFDLERFVTAQEPVFATVLTELKAGQKRTHWMWFVFPQLRGLGSSSMATFFGVGSLFEARAYLKHPVLGLRLKLCTQTVLDVPGRSAHQIFGSPDDLKLHSSMTLFAEAADDPASVFHLALERWWNGAADGKTLQLLSAGNRRR